MDEKLAFPIIGNIHVSTIIKTLAWLGLVEIVWMFILIFDFLNDPVVVFASVFASVLVLFLSWKVYKGKKIGWTLSLFLLIIAIIIILTQFIVNYRLDLNESFVCFSILDWVEFVFSFLYTVIIFVLVLHIKIRNFFCCF